MKKITAICISLILVLASAVLAFGDGLYEIDAQSGQIVDSHTDDETETEVDYVRLSSTCAYDKASDMFVFTNQGASNVSFSCSVYNGMYTTEDVILQADPSAQLRVFLNGEQLEFTDEILLDLPGTYIVRDRVNSLVLTFTVLNRVTNAVYSYQVPSLFVVNEVSLNGLNVSLNGNSVSFAEDGRYVVSYFCFETGKRYSLVLDVDHAAPELEIFGVDENGYAQNEVTFGPREAGSGISMKKNGEPVNFTDTIDNAGDYEITYTDIAGNASVYTFTVKPFLNANAWLVVLIAAAMVMMIAVFMIYSRTHMRVR